MKQKQMTQPDPLNERRQYIRGLISEHERTQGGTLTDSQRRWLKMELKHYTNGGDLDSWAAAKARIETLEANTKAWQAKQKAAEDEAKAKAAAQFAEIDAAIKAKIANELDPVTQYKRAHTTRTF